MGDLPLPGRQGALGRIRDLSPKAKVLTITLEGIAVIALRIARSSASIERMGAAINNIAKAAESISRAGADVPVIEETTKGRAYL